MAWVAEDTFDSYSDGSLGDLNGGTGWNAAWGVNRAVNTWTIQSSVVYQGTKAVSNSNGGGYNRQLATPISGSAVLYVAMQRTSASDGAAYFVLQNSSGASGTGDRLVLSMNGAGGDAGNVVCNGTTIITGYSANTWYVFRFTLDVAGDSYKVAHSTGAYGSQSTFSTDSISISMSSSGDIEYVDLDADTSATTQYFDYISPTSPFSSNTGPSMFQVF